MRHAKHHINLNKATHVSMTTDVAELRVNNITIVQMRDRGRRMNINGHFGHFS